MNTSSSAGKKRVHELAKELNLSSKDLLKTIKKIGVPAINHMSALEPHDVERIIQHLTPPEEKKVVEERVRPSIIRRRVQRLPHEAEKVEPAAEAVAELAAAAQGPEEKAPSPAAKPGKAMKPPAEAPIPAIEPVVQKPTAPVEAETAKSAEAKVEAPAEAAPEPAAPVSPTAEGTAAPAEVLVTETVSTPAPVSQAPAEAAKLPQKKKKPKPKIEPAQIIRRAEIPPPLEIESAVEAVEETRGAKKHIFIAEAEPREERIAKKKGKKEARVVVHPPRGMHKKERKTVLERRVEPPPPKKTELTVPKAIKRKIRVSEFITVGDLSKKMSVKASEVIKKLWELGFMATINQAIEVDTAQIIAAEFDYEVERVALDEEEMLAQEADDEAALMPRPPVITVMGHVDHGKTKLLDAIRQTNVTAQEAGGITQHIGAYHVKLEQGEIVFIDTPGHEAFTAMRARGSQVTDIVVLVVAANDGVQEQTVEAINHARDAKVPIIVAVNKIDLPEADPERVKRQLTEHGLVPEEWGGDSIFVDISAKQKINIDKLLEMILLQAEVLELKANPDKLARGVVIESRLDKGRGPVATVLVQEGTLKEGDPFIAGQVFGRVRALLDSTRKKIKKAGPSIPVEVVGFSGTPNAGDRFIAVSEERKARMLVELRQQKERQLELAKAGSVSLDNLYEKIKEEEVKELKLIIKADVHGSIEALKEALSGLSTSAIKLNVIHSSVGAISESDVMLATASQAVIIGFNVTADHKAQGLAATEKVDIRTYSIIYEVVDDIRKAMEGLLAPIRKEKMLGRAEVLQTFNISKVGTVAGSRIVDGKVVRGASVRLIRNDVVVHEGRIASLKRFKDDVKEAIAGYECGIQLESFNDIHQNDIIEAFTYEEVAAKLE